MNEIGSLGFLPFTVCRFRRRLDSEPDAEVVVIIDAILLRFWRDTRTKTKIISLSIILY